MECEHFLLRCCRQRPMLKKATIFLSFFLFFRFHRHKSPIHLRPERFCHNCSHSKKEFPTAFYFSSSSFDEWLSKHRLTEKDLVLAYKATVTEGKDGKNGGQRSRRDTICKCMRSVSNDCKASLQEKNFPRLMKLNLPVLN